MELRNYAPVDPEIWTGRIDDTSDYDAFRIHQVIRTIDLQKAIPSDTDTANLNLCILGFRCDEGIRRNLGRIGAERGPLDIRRELANIPVTFGTNIQIYDAGDIYCLGRDLEFAQKQLAIAVEKILDLGMFPIILGGGHEIAFGHYLGLRSFLDKKQPDSRIGIINFDAHFDLRPYKDKGSSGTMFSQIADFCTQRKKAFSYMVLGIQTYANTRSLFKRADSLGVKYILAKDITEHNLKQINAQIDRFVAENDYVYVTICFDVFNAAFAPGVSATQPFGMNPETVLPLLKRIFRSGKVISWDLAEVSPRFDHDNRTAKLAAVIIYAIINVFVEMLDSDEKTLPPLTIR